VAVVWTYPATAFQETSTPRAGVHAMPLQEQAIGEWDHLQLTVPIHQAPWFVSSAYVNPDGSSSGNLAILLARAASVPTYADTLHASQVGRRGGGNAAGILISGLGIFAGVGLAAYFKSQADGYYNEYLVSGNGEPTRRRSRPTIRPSSVSKPKQTA